MDTAIGYIFFPCFFFVPLDIENIQYEYSVGRYRSSYRLSPQWSLRGLQGSLRVLCNLHFKNSQIGTNNAKKIPVETMSKNASKSLLLLLMSFQIAETFCGIQFLKTNLQKARILDFYFRHFAVAHCA